MNAVLTKQGSRAGFGRLCVETHPLKFPHDLITQHISLLVALEEGKSDRAKRMATFVTCVLAYSIAFRVSLISSTATYRSMPTNYASLDRNGRLTLAQNKNI